MQQLAQKLIKEWEKRPLPQIIPRKNANLKYLPTKPGQTIGKITALTGFRRVGKTYLLLDTARKLGKNNTFYINFADERIPQETAFLSSLTEELEQYYKTPPTLLLDEIQVMPAWSKWLNRINELKKFQIVVTGSSSKLSSAEIPTELRGRAIELHVSPLSFREFLSFKEITQPTNQMATEQKESLLQEYLNYGGFPEIVLTPDEGKKLLILEEYFNTFVQRDIEERYNLRDDGTLGLLLKLLFGTTSYTATKLTNNLKSMGAQTSKTTVIRYLEHMQTNYFIDSVFLHNRNVKSQIQNQRKLYFVDNAFITRFNSGFSANKGRLMENAVYNRLRAQKRQGEIFYWKNRYEQEVDFLVRQQEQVKELVQVTCASSQAEIAEREVKSLIKAGQEFPEAKRTLVTWDYTGKLEKDGEEIEAIGLAEWLMRI